MGKDPGRCHLLPLLLVFSAMLRGQGPAPNQSMGQPPAHIPGSSCIGWPHFHLHPKVTPSLLPPVIQSHKKQGVLSYQSQSGVGGWGE